MSTMRSFLKNQHSSQIGLLCFLTTVIGGCASISPQEVGYLLGAITGGALASAPGAAAGALLGTAAGSMLAKPIEAARENQERKSLEEQLDAPNGATPTVPATPSVSAAASGTTPPLGASPPQRIWIDEQVIDGNVIPGHFTERYLSAEGWHSAPGASTADRTVDAQLQSASP